MKLLSSFIFLDTTSTHYLTFGNIFMGASIVCCLGEPEIFWGTVFYHAPGEPELVLKLWSGRTRTGFHKLIQNQSYISLTSL